MSKKSSKKMSEEEANKKLAQYEKIDKKIIPVGICCMLIGVAGVFLAAATDVGWIAVVAVIILFGGGIGILMRGNLQCKMETVVNNQLHDFYEAELEKAFGPRQRNKEMEIDVALIRELNPVAKYWSDCDEWRFYEGYYHGTHFSIENINLSSERNEPDGKFVDISFEGAVLRCKDVCEPTVDIALSGPGSDNQRDIMDPDVFSQFYSARTSDGQSADHLVSQQLREVFHKMGLVLGKYTVTAMILRNGEAILVIKGYSFGYGVPSKNLNLGETRFRFINSLTPACKIIDILRDNCGKL